MQKVTAIILAAGKGTRMKMECPKQFYLVEDKPLLYYSLAAFEESEVDDIVLVTNREYIDYCKEEIIEKNGLKKVHSIVEGGTERYWSVCNGLQACVETKYVLIHDSARPCIQKEQIDYFIKEVKQFGACSFGVPVKDTIKIVDDNQLGIETPTRSRLWQIQTPQGFLYDDLILAYDKMKKDERKDITDDTMILEEYLCKKTKIIMGDYRNIKATTPEDIRVLQFFLKN